MDLRSAIDNGQFYSLPFTDLLRLVRDEYPSELERLKTAYSIPVQSKTSPSEPSPSQILYNNDYDEINRTLVGLSMLRKIHDGDYAGFAGGQQPAAQRLRESSFAWTRSLFQLGLTTSDDLYTLITSFIISDLGKSPTLAEDLQRETTIEIGSQTKPNHDLILYLVVRHAPHLIPCLDRVPSSHREILIRSIEFGAIFNFGQMAQAECLKES
ncbi:hypothetical protein H072_11324 [Dactylellina haptotyla CBS 200.50]|uniref:Uncharacterized protein n=1 Tax=Dactylellina haptotyla (strain CBS 200.50) TaxID=1284197 RepID=S8B8H7_DACHA|nr:hypothetical protein H072_11324 [Dactylellina haptotyla CBS 200.50]